MSVSVVLRCRSVLRMLASVQAILHRASVGLKPLHLSQTHNLGTKGRQRAGRCLNEVSALEEIIHAQRRGKARSPTSRQDVVGPGEVVAKRLGRQMPQENSTSMMNIFEPRARVFDRQFQVFRSDGVG